MVLAAFNPTLKDIERSIKGSTRLLSDQQFQTLHILRDFINQNLYLLLVIKDIVLLRQLLKTNLNKDIKQVICRALAVQLYEFYEDISTIYNKNYERKYITPLNNQALFQLLISIKKIIIQIKADHIENLKVIRHNSFGHRDFDALKQKIIIDAIDIEEIVAISNIVTLFYYLLSKFETIYISVIFNVAPAKPTIYGNIKKFFGRRDLVDYMKNSNYFNPKPLR